jgi:acyl-CoA thioester hydrolase
VRNVSETTVRVRYAETDQMGIVYYANYFIWFEIGRVEFLRQLGFDYRKIEQEDGRFIAVADARCRYKAPARFDDLITIRTRLKGVRGPVIHFAYEILRQADGTLLAEGETSHVVTDTQMKMSTLPERYRRVFQEILAP